MIRTLLVSALAGALVIASPGAVFAEASAQGAPPQWLDPFCAVHVNVLPWNATANAPDQSGTTSTYRVQVISQKQGATIDAHVSLADDSDIYNARLRSAPLSGKAYELQTPAYLVTLPKSTQVSYAWVASYFVDDGAQVACPAEVSTVKPGVGLTVTPPDAGKTLTATVARSVGSLACGKVYEAPRISKGPHQTGVQVSESPEESSVSNSMWQPVTSADKGGPMQRHNTAYVVVFLDNDGVPVNTYVSQSTGVSDEDKIALQAAHDAIYAPAAFLCTPTVSHYVFEAPFTQ